MKKASNDERNNWASFEIWTMFFNQCMQTSSASSPSSPSSPSLCLAPFCTRMRKVNLLTRHHWSHSIPPPPVDLLTPPPHGTQPHARSTAAAGGQWAKNIFFSLGHSRPLFSFIFVFSTVNSRYVHYKILPITGFEPQTPGIGSDHSANLASTTAKNIIQPGFVRQWHFYTRTSGMINFIYCLAKLTYLPLPIN